MLINNRINNVMRLAIVTKVLLFLVIKIAVVIIALYGALFVFINAKGKDFILDAIKRKYGVQAQLDSFAFRFPLTFEMVNFRCGDLSFRKASASVFLIRPSDFPLSLDKVCVDKLDIKLTKTAQGWYIDPFLPKPSAGRAAPIKVAEPQLEPTQTGRRKNMSFTVKKLHCKNARLEFIGDFRRRIVLYFDNINLQVENLIYPELPKFSVELVASLRSPSGSRDMPELIKANGWIDYFHKSMDVALAVRNFDYIAYGDYYPEVWKPKNLRVKEAVLSLTADFKSQNNDLVIDALFSLEKISFLEASEEGSGARVRILEETIAHFQKGNEKPRYRFKTRTKMDSPEQFLPALLEDLRSSVPIGPSLIAEIAIEKTKKTISKGAEEVVEKTKKTISKGVEGVKKFTVDAALDTISSAVDAVKDIIVPSKGQKPTAKEEQPQE